MSIPVEFLPKLWVTEPEGLEGDGSGFLLAEGIETIFAVEVQFQQSSQRMGWTLLSLSKEQLANKMYMAALVRLIIESFTKGERIIIIGKREYLCGILVHFLIDGTGMKKRNAELAVLSKMK